MGFDGTKLTSISKTILLVNLKYSIDGSSIEVISSLKLPKIVKESLPKRVQKNLAKWYR